MLSIFNIIVAVDDKFGISKNGAIPWKNTEDMKWFYTLTTAQADNCVIMGRKTWESLPAEHKPLKNRLNIVVSSTMISSAVSNDKVPNNLPKDNKEVLIVPSLFEALKQSHGSANVFVIGGARIYEEAVMKFSYLCDKIYISHIVGDFDCDLFFPYHEAFKRAVDGTIKNHATFTLDTMTMDKSHPDRTYLKLVDEILDVQTVRPDRTGVGTKSLFGKHLEFDLTHGFPLLTTKRVSLPWIIRELLFFISGKTDTKILEAQGVNIWRGDTTAENLKKKNLPWQEGDMGPGYGFQWRHSGAEYKGCKEEIIYGGVDQLRKVIDNIKKDPYSRYHLVNAWNPADIPLMALPPCHYSFQFYVAQDDDGKPKYLDCLMNQRSADILLGVPFNIASYALLMHMVAHITDLTPRKLTINFGDSHIYMNHVEQMQEQMIRTPYPLPNLTFRRAIADIDDFVEEDFLLGDYKSWPALRGKLNN